MPAACRGADTSLLEMSYIDEDSSGSGSWGVIPSGNWQKVRLSGETLGVRKNVQSAEELRADRQVPDAVETSRYCDGDISGMLSYANYDDWFEAVMGGTWSSQVLKDNISATFDNGDSTIAGTNIQTSFSVGDVIRVSGTVSNDGFFVITATASGVLTVSPAPVDEVGVTCDIDTTRLGMGSACRSFAIQKHFTDIAAATAGKYVVHKGCVFDGYQLSVNAEGFVEVTFTVMGKETASDADDFIVGGTHTAAPANDIVSSSTGIGTIYENLGALSTGLLSLSLNVNGQHRIKPQLGSATPFGIGQGTFAVDGTVGAYYVNDTLLQRVLNHTASSLWFYFFDNQTNPEVGNAYAWNIHRLRFTEGSPRAQGPNGDVQQDLNYTGIYKSSPGYAVSMFRFAATA